MFRDHEWAEVGTVVIARLSCSRKGVRVTQVESIVPFIYSCSYEDRHLASLLVTETYLPVPFLYRELFLALKAMQLLPCTTARALADPDTEGLAVSVPSYLPALLLGSFALITNVKSSTGSATSGSLLPQ